VQGVCFRAATKKQAVKLDVKEGWVRSLPSGEVEIHALGTHVAIEHLIRWCYKGSTFARVAQVQVTELLVLEELTDFEIRKD
jgi:acylphosphatase